MCASFTDLLRESVLVAARLRSNVCWCACKTCKYKHGYHNGGHDNFWLNCNVGCKKHSLMQNMHF